MLCILFCAIIELTTWLCVQPLLGVVIVGLSESGVAKLEKIELRHPENGSIVRKSIELDVMVGDTQLSAHTFVKAN